MPRKKISPSSLETQPRSANVGLPQSRSGTQHLVGEFFDPGTIEVDGLNVNIDQSGPVTHRHDVSETDQTPSAAPHQPVGISEEQSHNYAALRMLSEAFEDAQKARIAIENRLRSGSEVGPAKDALDSLVFAEKKLSLAMRQQFRRTAPEISEWVNNTPGLGEHLMARFIGTIGHPVIASPYHWEGEGSDRVLVADQPYLRMVSQLWSYCGHGDAERRKVKGMSAEEAAALGNPRAKMLTRLMAEGCMKCNGSAKLESGPVHERNPLHIRPDSDSATNAPYPQSSAIVEPIPNGRSLSQSGFDPQSTSALSDPSLAMPRSIPTPASPNEEEGSESNRQSKPRVHAIRARSPYRNVYDFGRLKYAEREEWSDLHRHNASLRLTGKHILRDLWLVAGGETCLVHSIHSSN